MKQAAIHLSFDGLPLCGPVRETSVFDALTQLEMAKAKQSTESVDSCMRRWKLATARAVAARAEERVTIGPGHKATCTMCLARLRQFPQLANVRP